MSVLRRPTTKGLSPVIKLCATFILALMLASCATTSRIAPQAPRQAQWTLAIHAGGATIRRDAPAEQQQAVLDELARALETGRAILAAGGTSLDAVEATVRVLEDSPHFNAGHGAAVTAEGRHELDAAIMRGDTMAAGAVTGVRTSRNPITLARHVMENTDHVFMAWDGADGSAAPATAATARHMHKRHTLIRDSFRRQPPFAVSSIPDATRRRKQFHSCFRSTYPCMAFARRTA